MTPGQASFEDGPYAGLSPYGIAITALERILDLDETGSDAFDEARTIASEAATLAVVASTTAKPAPEPTVTMTPAVARPPFGSVLILALGANESDVSARPAAEALAAQDEGVTVVAVRGVEALRIWHPADATDELAAAMADLAKEIETAGCTGIGGAREIARRIRALAERAGLPS